jgi:hypothetical protein
MMFMGGKVRVAVWLESRQTDFVRAVCREAGLTPAYAGASGSGESRAVAEGLSALAFDDLRAGLASLDVDAFWLATGSGVPTGEEPGDVRAFTDAAQRGIVILSAEPFPASATAIGGACAGLIRAIALPRLASFWIGAQDVIREFGAVRLLLVEGWGLPEHGSLGARLMGLMDLVHSLLGEPEAVDAVHVGQRAASGLHVAPGATLRDLHGDMVVMLRFMGAAAVVSASDAAGGWSTTATLISERGRLRIGDAGWSWRGLDGSVVDEATPARKGRRAAPDLAVTTYAASISAALDTPPSIDATTILALAHAALLSARTGQPESPAMIRRLAGA